MDTLVFYEKKHLKLIEILICISITVVTILFVTLSPIMASENKIAHLSTPQIRIDTGQLQEAFMSELSLDYNKQKFDENTQKKYPKAIITDIDEGIKHIKLTKYYNNKPVRINIIEINHKLAKNIEIKPALSGEKTLHSRKKISAIAKQENAIAAINATFFKPQTGIPLGTLMIDRKIYTGPIYDRVAIGFFDNKTKPFDTARIQLDAKIIGSNQTIKVDNINQPRMLSTYILVYTANWGKSSPQAPKYGVNLLVQNGKIIKASANPIPLKQDSFVISGPKTKLYPLLEKKNAKLEIKTIPDWKNVKHIISGGPYLIKNNEIFIDINEQKLTAIGGRNPRSAIGYTKNNDFIIVTVDGREGSSIGLTLSELADFMLSIGCINAINLDGGGSTVMYIKGQIVNKPATIGGIAISNALVIRKK